MNDVSSGFRIVADEARVDGITHVAHYDWNRRSGFLGRKTRLRAARHDHVDLECHEVRGEILQPIVIPFRESAVDNERFALDVTQLAQLGLEDLHARLLIGCRFRAENADAVDLCRLLLRERIECAREAGDSHGYGDESSALHS